MTTINQNLADILVTIRRDGDFYATGTSEIAMPQLEVDGVGRIALPLLPVQAEQLIACASRSPFGRGEQTLIDTTVRKTWQIPAEQVHLSGRSWSATLAGIVNKAVVKLGVTEPVAAELYKLLIYDPGSFFVAHRDTEKSAGMFATLVLVLPSVCSGGELIVRHRDHEVCLDLNRADPSGAAFAAFYADCVHEVLPVTSGYRLTLIYNLLRQDGGVVPSLPDYGKERAALAALLRPWVAGKSAVGDDTPEKLICPLEHAYTSAELAFDRLKRADAAAGAVLALAAADADCVVHLALVTIEETGSAECDYAPHHWGREYEDDEATNFEVVEIHDRSLTVSDWRAPDGSRPALDALPFFDDELCPTDVFELDEPDEEHFHEATGNEGASFERTYRRAALVLWPRARTLAVLNQAGLAATLPYLADLASRWSQGGERRESELWHDAHTLAGFMLAGWPKLGRGYMGSAQPGQTTQMLASLVQLGDFECIETFLSTISASDGYKGDENAALVNAALLLGPSRAAACIERIIERHAFMQANACADLLARSAAASFAATLLYPAATCLVEMLLGERSNAYPPAEAWHRPVAPEPRLVDDLLTALSQLGATDLADRTVAHMLAHPQIFGIDSHLVPAALSLTERTATREAAAIQRLRTVCSEHLRARIELPLAPPADFARPSEVTCTCVHCVQLARFLVDPSRGTWDFRAVERDRRHVEASIKRDNCDLNFTTNRVGRPYGLICTKNQASYERRVRQRASDLGHVGRLSAAS